MRCCVVECKSRWNSNVSWHRVGNKRRQGLEPLLGKYLKFTKRTFICSAHFVEDDFTFYGTKRTLKEDAIPTINALNSDLKLPVIVPNVKDVIKARFNNLIRYNYQRDKKIVVFKVQPTTSLCFNNKSKESYRHKPVKNEHRTVQTASTSTLIQGIADDHSYCTTTKATQSTIKKRKSNSDGSVSPLRLIEVFHSYCHSPKYSSENLKKEKERTVKLRKKIKRSNQRNKGLLRYVTHLHGSIDLLGKHTKHIIVENKNI